MLNQRSWRPIFMALAIFTAATAVQATNFYGYITDQTTGQPLAGATVKIGNDTIAAAYNLTTNAQGYYSISGLPDALDYTVLASAPGHASQDHVFAARDYGSHIDFQLTAPTSGQLIPTINQGLRHYASNGDFLYRTDAQASPWSVTDINAQSSTITSLLNNIGAGPNISADPQIMWTKTQAVWDWLRLNARSIVGGDAQVQAANSYLTQNGWPSIQRLAETYDIYGIVPWGTCMSRAHICTTLLYRAGIPADNLAIAETRWKLRYSQHMYSALRFGDNWVYIDPSYNEYLTFPDFANASAVPWFQPNDIDYQHPYNLKTIPGATLNVVPLLTTTVPEPATFALLAFGLTLRRRRKPHHPRL